MTDTVDVPRELILRLSKAYDLGFEVETEIEELRALLAAEPPAVEEAEVVAFLMRPDHYEPYVSLSRDSRCNGVVEPLMTVDQHQRIISRLK